MSILNWMRCVEKKSIFRQHILIAVHLGQVALMEGEKA